MGDPRQHEVVLLRQSHWVRRAGAALACVAIAAELLDSSHERFFWILGFATLGVSLVLVGGEGLIRRVAASLGPEGIFVDGQLTVPSKTIRSGWVEKAGEGRVVHFDRGLRPGIAVQADNDARADDLLRDLAMDPVARFPTMSRASMVLAIVWGQLMGQALAHHRLASVLTACLLLAIAPLRVFWRDDVSVGSDGLLFVTTRVRRFVPFSDVESVTAVGTRRVVLRTRGGVRIDRWLKAAAACIFVERVEAALAERGRCAEVDRIPLRRQGLEVPAWLAKLRSLAQREPYRAAGPSTDALWRLMDDPGTDASERAAAAIVLGCLPTQEVRLRLRGVAARIVSPTVRVAIERVAEGAHADDVAAAMAAVTVDERLDGQARR